MVSKLEDLNNSHGLPSSENSLFSIAISLKRLADAAEQLVAERETERMVRKESGTKPAPAPEFKTIKLTAPVGEKLEEYIVRLEAALADRGYDTDSRPDEGGYRVLMFRRDCEQWTQVYRRVGNTRVLRVTGPETGLVVGLV